jgi:outer membrane protein OmpA-like peptidoglycan-associated protein
MRRFGLSLLACGLATAPFAALSQPGSTSTADEYVCALSPADCAPQQAAPAAEEQGNARLEATRGFTLARPDAAPTPARNTRAAPARNTRRVAARPVFRPRVATAQQGRVNLRLAFAPGSSSLSAAAQAEVRAFAEAMQRPQLATMRFRIEGHTDSVGGPRVNGPLSQRRAQAVADYLVAQGVAQARLEVQGYGFDRPLPGTPVSSGRNRRVEAVRIS